ncbi:sensor histidine kinase [Romboutsia sp. 1001713B170207_170306_H8]|nr:sensor histidine kinase [Romboutsia sp. 1001713B170207_170306_H8]
MNLLVSLTSIIFLYLDYLNYKKRVNNFINAVSDFNIENYELKESYEYKRVKNIIDKNEDEVKSLKKELEEINDYMTNWIHEVKIPISVLEIIGKRVSEIEYGKDLSKQIKAEVTRIDKLVEQAMYSSRAGNYNSDFFINEVNLENIVKEVIKKNKYQFIYNKIELNVLDLNKVILTDKKWITHIIELIIDNAIKYSESYGKIEIYTIENKKGLELHIKDYGIGIAPQDIDRVFDKGFTGVNGRKRTKSTGIGLYIAKNILTKLSHDINIISKQNEFTDVIITFYNLSDYFNTIE